MNKPIKVELHIPAKEKDIFPSVAFYCKEEEILDVLTRKEGELFPERAFIHLKGVRLVFDGLREINYIGLQYPKKEWQVKDQLLIPQNPIEARVFFINPIDDEFGDIIGIYTNFNKTVVHIQIAEKPSFTTYRVATSLLLDISEDMELIGIWILDIQDNGSAIMKGAWTK